MGTGGGVVPVVAHVRLFVAPWTAARQAPLSMEFSKQECWNVLPCPPPGDLTDPWMEPASLKSPACQVDSLPLVRLGKPPAPRLATKKAVIISLFPFHLHPPNTQHGTSLSVGQVETNDKVK